MRSSGPGSLLRRFAPLAVAAALHAAMLTTALPVAAQPPRTPAPAPAAPTDPIRLAQQQYEDLKYEESIQTLTGALVRPNNTKQQRIDIYRLLVIDFVTLNRMADADGAARNLLALEPTYELPRTESPRFRDFFTSAKKKWEDEGRPGLIKETEPPPAPITMQHTSPSQVEPSNEVPLTARFEDPTHRVTAVKLFYRTGTRSAFTELAASYDGTTARVNIPPSAVKPPFVEYYIIGFDRLNPVVSRGDATAPMRIAVPEPRGGGWVLPVTIVGAVVVVGAVFGGLALAGVFKSSTNNGPRTSAVSITIGE